MSSSLKRNTIYNAASASVPIVIAVVTTPYFLHTLGNSRFGIIALVWLLFNYFGIFDLGLSQATSNRLVKHENRAPSRQTEILWTALSVNAAFGVIGGALFYYSAGFLLARFGSLPEEVLPELPTSIIWMACLVPITTINSVFTGVLESRERFGELNTWQILGGIAGQTAPMLAIYLIAPRLDVALGATAMARLCFMIPVAVTALAQIGWRWQRPSRHVLKDLLGYGWWITATNLVSPLLVSADQFLIGAVLGVAAVPHYSIPFTLASKVLIVPGALVRALFPRLSRASAAEASLQALTVMGVIAWSLVTMCAPGMFLVEIALRLWLGTDFADQATSVARILLFGIWINGISQIPHILLQSQGRPDLPAKLHWIEVVPFIALLWVCIQYFGLIGAAVAWSARVALDCALLVWAAEFGLAAMRRLLAPFLILAASLMTTLFLALDDSATIALSVLVLVAAISAALQQDAEVRRLIKTFAARLRWS